MAKVKVDGLPGWEIESPSEKVIQADKLRVVKEGRDLYEAEPEEKKLQRQKNLFEAMRWDCKAIDEKLKSLKEKSDVKGKDLNPLDAEIKKLRKDFREFKLLLDLRGMRENSRAMSGFKSLVGEKKGIENIEETLALIEQFQEGSLSAERLLKELEGRGIFS